MRFPRATRLVVGFQHEWEARQFWTDLRERFAAYGLELHPEKTRLIEFGRYAADNRTRSGRGKPETFDFLGFTHVCGKTRKGRFALVRLTVRKRLRAKLREVKEAFRWRWHDPVPEVGQMAGLHHPWALQLLRGAPELRARSRPSHHQVICLWRRGLSRRSHKASITWERHAPDCPALPPQPPHRAPLAGPAAAPPT